MNEVKQQFREHFKTGRSGRILMAILCVLALLLLAVWGILRQDPFRGEAQPFDPVNGEQEGKYVSLEVIGIDNWSAAKGEEYYYVAQGSDKLLYLVRMTQDDFESMQKQYEYWTSTGSDEATAEPIEPVPLELKGYSTAFPDQSTVTFGGEPFVLELLHKTGHLNVVDPFRTHSGISLDDTGQFIDCVQAFFHVCFRLYIGADIIAVRQDRADIFLRYAGCQKGFFGVQEMFFRILLVIIVMKITDSFPVFPVFSEMVCHSAHGSHDIQGVDPQMFFRHYRIVQFFGSLQCKHRYILPFYPFLVLRTFQVFYSTMFSHGDKQSFYSVAKVRSLSARMPPTALPAVMTSRRKSRSGVQAAAA